MGDRPHQAIEDSSCKKATAGTAGSRARCTSSMVPPWAMADSISVAVSGYHVVQPGRAFVHRACVREGTTVAFGDDTVAVCW